MQSSIKTDRNVTSNKVIDIIYASFLSFFVVRNHYLHSIDNIYLIFLQFVSAGVG